MYLPLLLLAALMPLAFAISGGGLWLDVRLTVSHATTAEDLNRMQEFMSDNGYELKLEELSYDAKGKLLAIKGTVDFGYCKGSFYAPNLQTSTVHIKKAFFDRLKISIRGEQNFS